MLTRVPVGRFFATPCAPGTGGGVPGGSDFALPGARAPQPQQPLGQGCPSYALLTIPTPRPRPTRPCSPDPSVLQQRNAVVGFVIASSAVPGLLVVPTKRGYCRSRTLIGFTQDSASEQLLRAAKVLSTLPFHWLKSSRETIVTDPRKGRRGGDESLGECVSPLPPGTTRFRPCTCGRMTGGMGAKDAGNCSFSCAQAVRQPWLCYIEMSLMLFLSVGL